MSTVENFDDPSMPASQRERVITKATADQYRRVVLSLHSSLTCRCEPCVTQPRTTSDQDEAVSPHALLRALAVTDTISVKTAMMYRAALIWFFSGPTTDGPPLIGDPEQIRDAAALLCKSTTIISLRAKVEISDPVAYKETEQRFEKCERKVSRKDGGQSSRACRFISELDHRYLGRVLDSLQRNAPSLGRDAMGAKLFFDATIACGGRPQETFHVEWSDREKRLVSLMTEKKRVGTQHRDYKAQSSGGFGRVGSSDASVRFYEVVESIIDVRRVVRIKLESDAKAIDCWLEYRNSIESWSDPLVWKLQYKRMKEALRKANDICFQKIKYNFYSARHQFAADAKSVLPLVEVSREMGHTQGSSVARRSYGKKKNARSGMKQAQAQAQAEAQPLAVAPTVTSGASAHAPIDSNGQTPALADAQIESAELPPTASMDPDLDGPTDGDQGDGFERPRSRG